MLADSGHRFNSVAAICQHSFGGYPYLYGMAGELGHIIVNDDEEAVVCGCGLTCLEAQATATAIAQQRRAAVERASATLISDLVQGRVNCITTATVFCAAERGDPVAQSIVNRAGELIGFGLATLVSLCEPEKIIVGGGMADVGGLILKPWRGVVTLSPDAILLDF